MASPSTLTSETFPAGTNIPRDFSTSSCNVRLKSGAASSEEPSTAVRPAEMMTAFDVETAHSEIVEIKVGASNTMKGSYFTRTFTPLRKVKYRHCGEGL